MDSKEKTAFILLLDKNDGIITIFAQNCNKHGPSTGSGTFAFTNVKVIEPVEMPTESLNFEFLNL